MEQTQRRPCPRALPQFKNLLRVDALLSLVLLGRCGRTGAVTLRGNNTENCLLMVTQRPDPEPPLDQNLTHPRDFYDNTKRNNTL